jgi:hypothetical protein
MKLGNAIPFLLLAVAPATAQEVDYRDARIVLAEPGAMWHGANETEAEEAIPNLPWLPGDRVWTESGARMEIQFADGTLVQLAEDTRLDYEASDLDRNTTVLRLWTGSLYLIARGRAASPAFEIETESGVVYVNEAGATRVDAIPGETRVSVYRGTAQLSAGGDTVTLYPGERSYATFGRAAEVPQRFDHQAADAFDAWSRARRDRYAAVYSPTDLPEEIEPYAADLEEHGSWAVVADVGYVWRPRVAVSWTPYSHGRWARSAYGWVWIAYEPWGWAPFHYGRWGHSLDLGWYWIPGRRWSGAWVSWRVGGGYVGWCALGRRGRPVRYLYRGRDHRHYSGHGWTYARHSALGARDLSRHLVREDRIPRQRLSQLAAESQPPGARRAVSRWGRSERDRSRGPAARSTSPSPRVRSGSAGTVRGRGGERSGVSRREPRRSSDPGLEALRRMRSGASNRTPRRSEDPGLEALRRMRSTPSRRDSSRGVRDASRSTQRLRRSPDRDTSSRTRGMGDAARSTQRLRRSPDREPQSRTRGVRAAPRRDDSVRAPDRGRTRGPEARSSRSRSSSSTRSPSRGSGSRSSSVRARSGDDRGRESSGQRGARRRERNRDQR